MSTFSALHSTISVAKIGYSGKGGVSLVFTGVCKSDFGVSAKRRFWHAVCTFIGLSGLVSNSVLSAGKDAHGARK